MNKPVLLESYREEAEFRNNLPVDMMKAGHQFIGILKKIEERKNTMGTQTFRMYFFVGEVESEPAQVAIPSFRIDLTESTEFKRGMSHIIMYSDKKDSYGNQMYTIHPQ